MTITIVLSADLTDLRKFFCYLAVIEKKVRVTSHDRQIVTAADVSMLILMLYPAFNGISI